MLCPFDDKDGSQGAYRDEEEEDDEEEEVSDALVRTREDLGYAWIRPEQPTRRTS